ncbi:hypothetical protein SH528x_003908 [Novipirellula sp. SH528]
MGTAREFAVTRHDYELALQNSGEHSDAITEVEAALQLRPDYNAVRL